MNSEIENELINICKLIKDEYYKVEKNEDSSDGNVYVLYCKKNNYIVKVYNDMQHAKAMIGLHKKLIQYDINIPHIIYTNFDEAHNRENCECIVVYSFINGKQISSMLNNGKIEENLIISIAKEIRKMHNISIEKNEINLPELSFDTYNNRKVILHFDLTKSNIFCDENANIAIIDFDDAKYGSAVYDISILISTFFFSKSRGIDINGMEKFLKEYYEDDVVLRNKERPLIKICAIQWIDYLLNENKLDSLLIESFKAKRQFISENL